MFLACAYGEAADGDEQRQLEKAVKNAVAFTCKAQTLRKHSKPEGKQVEIGGWGYVSSQDGANFDEGSVTVSALQALRAAKNAAIPVPKENIDRAVNYLEACTTSKGGIIYSYTNSGGVAMAGQEPPAANCRGDLLRVQPPASTRANCPRSGSSSVRTTSRCRRGASRTTSTRTTTSLSSCTRWVRSATGRCSPTSRRTPG